MTSRWYSPNYSHDDGNEDAGDLEITNRAGYFESVAEDHENHDKGYPTKDCWICAEEHGENKSPSEEDRWEDSA